MRPLLFAALLAGFGFLCAIFVVEIGALLLFQPAGPQRPAAR